MALYTSVVYLSLKVQRFNTFLIIFLPLFYVGDGPEFINLINHCKQNDYSHVVFHGKKSQEFCLNGYRNLFVQLSLRCVVSPFH